MKEENPLVSRNLKWLIDKAEINENKLAEELTKGGKKGVPQPTIHRIIAGQHKSPRNSTLEPIAKFFGVKLSDLLEWDFSAKGYPATNVKDEGKPYREPSPGFSAWIKLWDDMTPHERDAVMEQIPITRRHALGDKKGKTMEGGGKKELTRPQK